MKHRIRDMVRNAAAAAHRKGALPADVFPEVEVEEPKAEAHGDFSTNFALISARPQRMAPRKIAEVLCNHIQDPGGVIEKTEIAGPGFINFFVRPSAWHPVLEDILRQGHRYGGPDIGNGKRVQVEFVSSNPTGPLHVGHGRGAAVGDAMANILKFSGFDVQREYYINDSGRQIHTLGRSVVLRYRELMGETLAFPEDCYQGGYIRDLARAIQRQKGEDLLDRLSPEDAVAECAGIAAANIITGIRKDLLAFGVTFDRWFSEQSLYDSGRVDAVIQEFRDRDLVYEKDGALWFRTQSYGDEKDRVVVRGNGQTTYFASDIAYHQEKFSRGFDRVIDVWGADHHGYIPRIKASVAASGRDPDRFQVILVQLVNLLRGGEPVAMSTRAGEFVTLRDVIDEVGPDAARFIFLTRHHESPLDFDLELAKQKTNDNPVYYVQYVHARISSIVRKGKERGIPVDAPGAGDALGVLTEPEEIQLIQCMARYPEAVETSAVMLEPHRITYYLMDLAAGFHAYYNNHRVLTEDGRTSSARLRLVLAVQQVIRNGLTLLGVCAPERM